MADETATTPEDAGPVAAAEAALDRLAARLRPPSIGAQIRRLLPKIEAAIESGATHEQIVQTLQESGIALSLKTFRSALYRARKTAAKGGRKGGSGTKVRAATEGVRDPLAVPPKPQAFVWDPTARPSITFIRKDDESAS
jgi:hypothetical protein